MIAFCASVMSDWLPGAPRLVGPVEVVVETVVEGVADVVTDDRVADVRDGALVGASDVGATFPPEPAVRCAVEVVALADDDELAAASACALVSSTSVCFASVRLVFAICRALASAVVSRLPRTWPAFTASPMATSMDATVPAAENAAWAAVTSARVPAAETVWLTVPFAATAVR